MQQLQAFYRQYCPPASIPPVYKPFSAFYFSYHSNYNTRYCFLQQQVSKNNKNFQEFCKSSKQYFMACLHPFKLPYLSAAGRCLLKEESAETDALALFQHLSDE
jgi:hypothetical protein